MKQFPELYIYNTLTRKKDKFVPRDFGKVSLYCCGITAYGPSHVGHARAFVVFDVIYRFLNSLGYHVKFVRNFTDVDDKIIQRAHEEGSTSLEVAKKNIHQFHEDARALKLLPPTEEPRATEHIEEICEIIEHLLEKDIAYEVDGEVFYSVKKFPTYGKLSKKKIDELQAGARIEIGEKKKDPLDFVLWKPSKEGEPSWDSPWGRGRPGWHIECSAMSQKYLGKTFDIHGGGADLIFPHHENEIAQSEAANGKPFANYWIHNGLVQLGKEKMSKSLGNIVTVREFLKKHSAEVLRLWVLSNHYRSPLGFSQTHVKDAIIRLERFYKVALLINQVLQKNCHPQTRVPAFAGINSGGDEKLPTPGSEEKELLTDIHVLKERFQDSMLDDFNSAKAMGYVFEVVRKLNQHLNKSHFKASSMTKGLLEEAQKIFSSIGEVLGIFQEDPQVYLPQLYEQLLPESMTREKLEDLIRERNKAREEKNWNRADDIRKELTIHHIVLEDNPQGTTWRIQLDE